MSLEGLTVLALEDEPIISITLEDLLTDAGAFPLMTSTLAEAADAIASRQVDAAILDVNIHGEASYPVALKLVAQNIPFIFASGYGGALHPHELSHVPTLPKPYDLADIIGALVR